MRIAFICSRLGRGRDGVGDYVRRLSVELVSQGHPVLALALRDTRDETEEPAGGPRIRRFHAADSPDLARAELADFAPEWISLQWVPYGWHPRGLPWSAGDRLAALHPTTPNRHLMAHELWVGENRGAPPLDRRLWRPLQRIVTRRLARAWRPALVHTTTPVYAAMLADLGLRASLLPLPGNLPAPGPDDAAWALAWLRDHGLAGETPALLAGVFGTLHPEWDPAAALRCWTAHARAAGRAPALLALGRLGPDGEGKLDEIRSAAPGLGVVRGGELPAGRIAALLDRCAFGLASSPLALLGKSGSVAACLDLGLPVLVTRDDWRSAFCAPAPVRHALVRHFSPAAPAFAWDDFLALRRPPRDTAPGTARDFASALASARPRPS